MSVRGQTFLITNRRRLLMIIALTISALIAAASLLRPTVTGQVRAQDIRHDGEFAYVVPLPSTRNWLYRLKTDRTVGVGASRLQLRENGKTLGPPHSSPLEVRKLGKGRYGHWGTQLWFSSSDGTDTRNNGRSYEFRAKLSLTPLWASVGIVSFVLALVLLAAALVQRRPWRQANRLSELLASWTLIVAMLSRRGNSLVVAVTRAWRRHGIWLVRSPILAVRGIGYLLLAGSLVFAIASVFALLFQWALPTSAPIKWFPFLYWAATYEPLLYLVLFSLTLSAAIASWLSILFRRTSALRRDEIVLGRFLRRWGLFLIAALFVFSISGIWAGLVREGDFNWASIAGVLPFSDANGHFVAAHDQAKDGIWSAFALRRPIAAAFRSSLMYFSGHMHAVAVLLQAILLAGAVYIASRAVASWRGIYAGLVFFAFSYVTVRTYLPTFLTEPLGLIWALLAIPFLITALRTGSLQNGLIGLAMTAVAMFIRPGGMFVIAALCLWLVWRFGNNVGQRIRTASYAVVVVISVAGVSHLLNRAYGIGSELTGSNFSYVLCGLSIGTDWSGCVDRYEEAGKFGSEKLVTDFMYQKAIENIAARPEVIVSRLSVSALAFSRELPVVLWRGYSWWGSDYSKLRLAVFAVVGAGLLYIAIHRRERDEILFWLLLWLSVIASAALVHFDDGRRVMSASYPLLWLFLSGGLLTSAVPISNPIDAKRLARVGWSGLLIAALMFMIVPWLAHRLSPISDLQKSLEATTKPNEHTVYIGKRATGVLVVPDGAEARSGFPTMSSTRFAEFVKASNVEIYQGILNPRAPEAPFGFIWAPRVEKNANSDYDYIVPLEVLLRTDVKVWRFHVREWNRKEPFGSYWFYVDRAEPLL